MSELFSLRGRVALVTGSSRGLGWAMAQALAAAGAHVVLNGRDGRTLDGRVAELAGQDHAASSAPFDVADHAGAAAALQAIWSRHGRLDVLVNNAGIQHRAPAIDIATADWMRIIDTNLTACFVLAREAARLMLAQGGGRIVNISSIMGRIARPTVAAYTAAKSGLDGLTRALAVELAPHGIAVNAIAPGYFATELNSRLVADPDFNAFVCRRTPLGRWGRVDEIGGAAVFLASDAASYVTGHVLTVDGGVTAAL